MNMKRKINFIFFLILLSGCQTPGMYMKNSNSNSNEVYIESLNRNISVENISAVNVEENNYEYKIGNGDQIAVTIWGLPEIFPITNISADQNLRRVDSNGNIYFPFVGVLKASGKNQDQLRSDLVNALSKNFNDPQLDVSVAKFNSQKVYILGEVTRPKRVNLQDVPLSLAEALGEVSGLKTETSQGSGVFIIRQNGDNPKIFRADLSSPSGFLDAGRFFLQDNDIVYVNASGTTRWNRVISQFFPFSAFITSIDNLANRIED